MIQYRLGIALAFVCAAKGYPLRVFLPQGMSREREALLRMYGARVEVVESMGGMNEAVDAARAMAPGEQREMAEGMVARLEERLKGDPANVEGWVMLMRSRVVPIGKLVGACQMTLTSRLLISDI